MILRHSLALAPPTKQSGAAHKPPKVRFFNFLQQDDFLICNSGYYLATRTIDEISFIEMKCQHADEWYLRLHNTEQTFWLAFQLLGESTIAAPQKQQLLTFEYIGFFNRDNEVQFQPTPGKMWMIWIGLEINDLSGLQKEWKLFAHDQDNTFHILPPVKILYRIRKVLEQIQQLKDSPFTLRYKLSAPVIQLLETYHRDLVEQSKAIKHADVSLFHLAKEYIRAHYMDEGINISTMAKELLTSDRTLYRVFKENGLTVNSAIQSIRIYKGREMLRRTNLSVDMIAFRLHFSTAKYFIKQYVKYFGHTPAAERQLKETQELAKFEKKGVEERE